MNNGFNVCLDLEKIHSSSSIVSNIQDQVSSRDLLDPFIEIEEQIKTPILDVIETSVKNPAYQFHIPGHTGRKSLPIFKKCALAYKFTNYPVEKMHY